jgi:hypothetical protein
MLRFDALEVDAQKSIAGLAIELFLQDLGEQCGVPDEWQATAADDAISAFYRGEYGYALTCICAGESVRPQRSAPSPVLDAKAHLSLRDLWHRFACARSAVVLEHTSNWRS